MLEQSICDAYYAAALITHQYDIVVQPPLF